MHVLRPAWSFIIVKTALTKATLKLTKQPALSWDLLNKFWLWPLRLELHLYVYLHVKTWHQNGIFIFGISSELLSSETLHPFHTTLIPSRFCQVAFLHGYYEQPFMGELQQLAMQIGVSKTIKNTSVKFLDAFVDHVFEFIDQPLLPNQSNFAPVDVISSIEGEIPDDFPKGDSPAILSAYILNLLMFLSIWGSSTQLLKITCHKRSASLH
ncbi:hypothetical protein ACOSQ3_016592 [Xanthoceras sorbifolium]